MRSLWAWGGRASRVGVGGAGRCGAAFGNLGIGDGVAWRLTMRRRVWRWGGCRRARLFSTVLVRATMERGDEEG